MKKIMLSIEGMTCSACSSGLEKYLNKQSGIENASVNLVMANALIEYNENLLDKEKIEEFIKEAGFKSLGIYHEIEVENKRKKEKIKFILFSILAIILIYISMGHMIGLPTIDFINMHIKPINYTVILFVLTSVFLIYGWDIIKNGYKNLIHKTPNMDTLVGIGVISSMLYSFYSMYKILQGEHYYVENLYFESVAIIIYFIKLGRYIDGISKDKTKEAIQNLVKITPNHATIMKDGVERLVTLDEIGKGDIVISKPGDKIAVDGEIIGGKAHLDESFITGESKPINRIVGEKVIAGSINFDGYLEYRAEKIGKESTISEIVRLVTEATNTKAPIAKLADKVSGYFVPLVMAIAIITFIIYLILGYQFGEALNVFITILVVACPCSLGLATPLAIVVSEGICAKNGILVKKSEILENAQKVNTIVFDKTGTLTYGTLKIAELILFKKVDISQNYSVEQPKDTNQIRKGNLNTEEKKLLQLVGSLESKSTHPIGKAFLEYLKENEIETLPVEDFEDIAGYGITGKVQGQEMIIGNAKILEKYHVSNLYQEEEEKLAKKGDSIIYVVKEKEIIAIIGVNDIIRENAKEIINELNKNKIQTIMLTGDNKETSEKIAKDIGIEKVISNVLPSQKADVIKELKQENKFVMMCGDGINDSPALATSHIGVSFNSGTDIAMDSSDVILTKNDLKSILKLIHISKRTIRNIKQNLFWAFFYNFLMIPIAIGILKPWGIVINPMIASLAMVFSSLTVVLNSLRLRK